MKKFMLWIEEKMTPVANALGKERHLASMQKGFMMILPMIFVGAVFMLLANPPVTADMVASGGFWGLFSGWVNWASANKVTILIPYNLTMGYLSVGVAYGIAYYLAESYEMKPITNGLTSMIVFLIVAAAPSYMQLADGTTSLLMPMTYLGAQGMFTAIFVALITVDISRFCENKHITIKLPDACPPALTDSFSTIIPMLINVSVFFILSRVLISLTGNSLPAAIEWLLAKPVGAVNSLPGAIALCAFQLLLWCCGVHGQMVTMAVTTPIVMQAFASNAELFAAGQAPIFYPIFMTLAIGFLGGTGNTFGLCVLSCWKAKSEQLKAFGKATIVPSFFRISEPALFGAPIVFNPVLMIPFILNGLIVAIFYWLVCSAGLLTAPYLMISGTYPIFLSLFVYCLDWRCVVFLAGMIPITMLVWYPFFRVYDDSLYKKEQEEKAAAETNA